MLVTALTVLAAALVTPMAASAAPFCGITWGSLLNQGSHAGATPAQLVNIRAGRHLCYDRLVLDLRGTATSWRAEYVSQAFRGESDHILPVRGAAILRITVQASEFTIDANDNLVLTYNPPDRDRVVNVAGFRTFRQVSDTGTFEGLTTIYLGVRARLPFRVFVLAGIPGSSHGTRVVIDVAHRWQ